MWRLLCVSSKDSPTGHAVVDVGEWLSWWWKRCVVNVELVLRGRVMSLVL